MQEILISKKEDKKTIALVKDYKLEEIYYESNENERLEGNIYYGIIRNVLPGMQAAFVDIGYKENSFLHLKDILSKVSNVTGNKNEDLDKYNISDYVRNEMPVMVQVKKDATGSKGAKVSTNIHIPGRFVVIIPQDNFITVSKKIESEEERQRLKNIASSCQKNGEMLGMIIRTAAENKKEEEIKKDIINTIEKWNRIKENFENIRKKQSKNLSKINTPKTLYKLNSIIEKLLLDTIDNGVDKIYVDDKDLYNEISNILNNINEENNIELILKEDDNLLDMYDIDDQIEKSKQRKVWLKCGGFITIDKTEALTAIDINSGKFTGKENLETTVLKVNQEASIEIAKQLKLRDIGGIIIIDYIDMQEEHSRNKVLEVLNRELKKDRSKTQIIEFTKLNLLELTRKHMFSN